MQLNKQHIQRQFDRSAARYDGLAIIQRSIVDDLVSLMPSGDMAKADVADFGCGTAYALNRLRDIYLESNLTGLDLAPSMLDVAQQRIPSATFVQGDIECLPFAGASFDLSWSSSAIQWCDLTLAVSELARVTRFGGVLAMSTFIAGTLDEWRRLWLLGDEQRFACLPDVESACRKAGLADIKLTSKIYEQKFYSFEEAVASIRDLGAGNAERERKSGLLGRAEYQRIRSQVESIISQQGCLSLPYHVAFITARKA